MMDFSFLLLKTFDCMGIWLLLAMKTDPAFLFHLFQYVCYKRLGDKPRK